MAEQAPNNNQEIARGTHKTSFFLGLMSGVAAASTLALIGLFVLLFSGQNLNISKNGKVGQASEGTNTNQLVANPEPAPAAEVLPVTGLDHVRGGQDAKVTLIEYSDFQCPYCARHYGTMKKIAEDYGDKVRIVFRHFPLSFHPEAEKAAEASECAAEQGKFWEMHDKIFEANLAGTMSVTKWKEEAKNLGLNVKKFNDCLNSGEYASKVSEQTSGGAAAGVEGTPATFVNNELISGALPYEQFKQIIDNKL